MRSRHLLAIVLAVVVALPALFTTSAGAGDDPCPGTEVEVRGRVTDLVDGQPIPEDAGVEHTPRGSGTPADGGVTDAARRFSVCLLPDTYDMVFRADSYRVDANAMKVVEVTGDGPIVVDVALRPRGLVLDGRITNRGGRPVFASIGVFRQRPNGQWVSIDGVGNDDATGRWRYTVPGPGRYRVNASVDHHWSRWHRDATRLRFARVLVLDGTRTFARNVDIAVPYCTSSVGGAFCVPPGFLT